MVKSTDSPSCESPLLPQQSTLYCCRVYCYILQPNNVKIIEYGRLVMDGELKVKCEGESTQSMRYLLNYPFTYLLSLASVGTLFCHYDVATIKIDTRKLS